VSCEFLSEAGADPAQQQKKIYNFCADTSSEKSSGDWEIKIEVRPYSYKLPGSFRS